MGRRREILVEEKPKVGYYAHRAAKRRKRIDDRDTKDPFYYNKGWFRKGYDPRRHIFTKEECQIGYGEAIFQIENSYPKLRKKGRAERALRSFMGREGR